VAVDVIYVHLQLSTSISTSKVTFSVQRLDISWRLYLYIRTTKLIFVMNSEQ